MLLHDDVNNADAPALTTPVETERFSFAKVSGVHTSLADVCAAGYPATPNISHQDLALQSSTATSHAHRTPGTGTKKDVIEFSPHSPFTVQNGQEEPVPCMAVGRETNQVGILTAAVQLWQ
ncbi:hypothetical protein P7K49_013372 [Saguinus oedipus]|uniref:Uncharacterized protein n=1 Tax=Saguinus oedipus TaxID=9490 RepID=A0ABQ9VG39_SAGOE|nr:hypothetical protein P7K49_013372 [Saguinus oedipus]